MPFIPGTSQALQAGLSPQSRRRNAVLPGSPISIGRPVGGRNPSPEFVQLRRSITLGSIMGVEVQLGIILRSNPRPEEMWQSVSFAFSCGKEVIGRTLFMAFSAHIRGDVDWGGIREEGQPIARVPGPVVTRMLLDSIPGISSLGVDFFVQQGATVSSDLVHLLERNGCFDMACYVLREYGFQKGVVKSVYLYPGDPGSGEFDRSVALVDSLLMTPSAWNDCFVFDEPDAGAALDGRRSFMLFVVNRLREYSEENAAPIEGSFSNELHTLSQRVIYDFIALGHLIETRGVQEYHRELEASHRQVMD